MPKHPGFFKKYHTQLFQLLFLATGASLAVWFIRANAGEVRQILPLLAHSRLDCILAGIALTGVYIWLQGLMGSGSKRLIGDFNQLNYNRLKLVFNPFDHYQYLYQK